MHDFHIEVKIKFFVYARLSYRSQNKILCLCTTFMSKTKSNFYTEFVYL
jgi:hypothetical protein